MYSVCGILSAYLTVIWLSIFQPISKQSFVIPLSSRISCITLVTVVSLCHESFLNCIWVLFSASFCQILVGHTIFSRGSLGYLVRFHSPDSRSRRLDENQEMRLTRWRELSCIMMEQYFIFMRGSHTVPAGSNVQWVEGLFWATVSGGRTSYRVFDSG